ncbi:predicted protein [Postia placenta Mad-698-R]|uniref:O-methyltransferase C-terminal domain-containing protein n=1 Tax=Postia placenta MAD-698-R-SB12 TaxID=670580 RepID=A0A1X6NI17_9APHY|nr:hypothetical protein POSPLADRAFT_1052209 [Postia placenta MAD-698-R-SB12]EED84744.1 predicted protein [Postia placenta Mad-698-R]OSX68076.1 hypothetical protein POSPLADRAFT_1052209 [Postia placenta MAD-698-R-SB12]
MVVAQRAQTLRALVRLLANAAETVIREWESERALADTAEGTFAAHIPSPGLYEAGRVIVGACGECIALVQDPVERLLEVTTSTCAAKALQIAARARVAEVLSQGDTDRGVSIQSISSQTGISDKKLLQVLRCLTFNSIFAEPQRDHFANTALSQRLVRNDGLRCLITMWGDVGTAADKLPSVLFDPVKTHSTSPREAAFQVAYQTDLTLFEYLERGQNAPRFEGEPLHLETWMVGMHTIGETEAAASYVDYPWAALGSKLVVDVGGGVGGMSLELAKRYPQLNFVVQDREAVTKKAEAVWAQALSRPALETGRVRFMPHDFFTEQPVKGADIYLMRHILHDWSDEECTIILRHLREAMRPDSLLLVAEKVTHTATGSPHLKSAPTPLPPNYGYAQMVPGTYAIGMMSLLNGVERTPEEFIDLAEKAGLRLIKLWECRGLVHVIEMRRDDSSPMLK